MDHLRCPRFLVIAALCCSIFAGPTAAAEPLRVGVAETDITPPEGFLMAGYYHERRATGTRDPLKARALGSVDWAVQQRVRLRELP